MTIGLDLEDNNQFKTSNVVLINMFNDVYQVCFNEQMMNGWIA